MLRSFCGVAARQRHVRIGDGFCSCPSRLLCDPTYDARPQPPEACDAAMILWDAWSTASPLRVASERRFCSLL